MNFTTSNKTSVYNDLSQVSYDEEYMKYINSDLDIPKDILLRLETYLEEKKKAAKSKRKSKQKK